MSELYNTISGLCETRGISIYKLCKEIGIRGSVMSDLKCGRKESLSTKTLSLVSEYLNVSVGYLLGAEKEKPPTDSDEGPSNNDLIRLWSSLSPDEILRMRDFALGMIANRQSDSSHPE